MDNLPKYFMIDGDIFVKVFQDGDEVRAVNHNGVAYPPFNAVRNGVVITKEEYQAGRATYFPQRHDE